MSDYKVEITETSEYTISIDTSLVQNENNVEVQLTSPTNVDIIGNNTTIFTSDISDFNSAVSGLIPVKNISAGSGIGISSVSGDFTVSVTGSFGLTSEEVDDRVSNLLVAGNYVNLNYNDLGNSLTISVTGVQPSGNYSLVGHSHNSSDITNFDSAVSGLLPSVSGSGYAAASFNNNVYTISVTGVQPSGNYSIVGHTHSSSDITNFNSSVSGLLPTISNSGDNRILTSTGSSIGINAESNATFDGTTLAVSGALVVDKIKIDNHVIYAQTPTGNTHFLGISVDQLTIDTTEYSSAAGSGGVTIFGNNNPTLVITNEEDTNYPTEIKLRSAGGSSNKLIIGSYNTENYNGNGPSTNVNEIYSLADYDLSILAESGSLNLNAFNNSVNIGPILNIDNLRLDSNTISSTNTNGNIIISPTGTGSVGIKQNNPNYTLDVNGSGNFSSGLYVNHILVSVSGHTHTSSQITDFGSSVSGLLPSISGSGYILSTFNNNLYTISATGLQPSGNYSVVGHSHVIADVSGLQNALDSKQPSGIYASGIHSHGNISNNGTIGSTSGLLVTTGSSGILTTSSGINSSYITNFNSSVSGLLPSVSGSGYAVASFNNNVYTISVTGVQPSGNYSIVGHTHLYTDITNFASGVEQEVSTLLVAGNYINLNYNDIADTLTISATGLQPSGVYASGIHTHTASQITDFNTSVSGLLPTISNSGNNRLLTSDGTSTGINAESSVLITEDGTLNPTNGVVINDNAKTIVFSGNRPTALQIFNIASLDQNEFSEASLSWSLGVVSSGSSLNYINGSSSAVFSSIPSGISNSGVMTGSAVTSYRNAVSSYDDNGSLLLLIGQNISYGHAWAESTSTNTTVARGLSISPVAGAGTIENVYDIFLTNTVYDTVIDSSGTIQQGAGVISNRYGIYQDSADPNLLNGSLTVGSGLSSPTPIFSLGSVSGDVSINYGIDKQIQTLTLNGTNTNFIEGSGWDIANKSVDVFLEITVTSTTTVTWTLIDDQYNPFPTFTAGKYLVLLRSMGTIIQGHYIGDKTN